MDDLAPLDEIFDIEYGTQLDKNKLLSDKNGINFVSRSSKFLGVVGRVKQIPNLPPYEQGLITVSLNGSYLLSSFVQPEPFYTAQNVKVLRPKIEMSFRKKVFYCYAITKNRFRYASHGREANKTLDDLLVPNINIIPGWVDTVKIAEISKKPTTINDLIKLEPEKWKAFFFRELFDIKGSKTTPYRNIKYGGQLKKYPYVGDTGNK